LEKRREPSRSLCVTNCRYSMYGCLGGFHVFIVIRPEK